MSTPTPENNPAEVTNAEIEAAQTAIDKQEEKVENATTKEEEKKESEKLDQLVEKFDALIERMGNIETRLNEPTVPAPEAKQETPPVSAQPVGEVTTSEPEAKPKKRRLGAWGS